MAQPMTAGILLFPQVDLGLHLLERFYGEKARRREAARLDGPWE